MTILNFFLKRDFKDNRLFWMAPFVLFSLMFALTHFWKTGDLSAQQLKIGLQVCTFLFIFVSATLYGVYINSVIGSALNVRTQMSLTRSYLFSLPIARATLFKLNQIRLLLPLMPYVVLGTFFIITFNPIFASKYSALGLLSVGICLSLLLENYFSWLSYLIEKSFENRNFSHAFKGFFVVNPILLLVIYFLFAKNLQSLSQGLSWQHGVAFLAPGMMISLNYLNWMKRD